MELFDRWVDDLRSGETIIANYDTGLQISINYEAMTFTDDDGLNFSVSDDDLLKLMRVFLEAYVTAREEPLDVNYDDLLDGKI